MIKKLTALGMIFVFAVFVGATWPSDSARTKNWSSSEILTEPDLEGQFDVIHTWLNDAMDETNGHKHDGTSNEGPKILTANIDDSAGTAGDTYYSSGTAISRLAIGTAGQFFKTNSGATAPEWDTFTWDDLPDGAVVQIVNTVTGAVSTGTTDMPDDDTIPQSSEGDQYMTLAITPKATTNKLKIEVVVYGAESNSDNWIAGLFQDSTANALAGGYSSSQGSSQSLVNGVTFTHYMDAGTTSATTFKVRAGGQGGTFTFNGRASARRLGGVMASSITITEIKAS